MTRLLGLIIANGVSSESRVFTSLLAHRHDRYEPSLLVHEASRDGGETGRTLGRLADAPVMSFDTGWRRNPSLRRTVRRAGIAATFVRRLPTMAGMARDVAPDVVYSSQQHYDCRAASHIASELGIPQIVHLHYNFGPWLRHSVVDRVRNADHVVAVSDFLARQLVAGGVAEDRVTTIRNSMRPFEPSDPALVADLRARLGVNDAFVFGMVGRLDFNKGHLDAIAALERCGRSEVRLLIVGSGRVERQIRKRAASSPAADRIVFAGFRNDIPDVLAAVDALLHPASMDPCPLAVLEGMAAGRCVVAYHDGGIPEMIVDGESGRLVPHGDIGALAAAMGELVDDRNLLDQLAQAGRARLSRSFRPDDAGDAFADLVTGL